MENITLRVPVWWLKLNNLLHLGSVVLKSNNDFQKFYNSLKRNAWHLQLVFFSNSAHVSLSWGFTQTKTKTAILRFYILSDKFTRILEEFTFNVVLLRLDLPLHQDSFKLFSKRLISTI